MKLFSIDSIFYAEYRKTNEKIINDVIAAKKKMLTVAILSLPRLDTFSVAILNCSL